MSISKVSIIYLVWADEPDKFLEQALNGVIGQGYAKDKLNLVIVYNGPRNNEKSSIDFIKNQVKKYSDTLPETIILEPETNLGFSGGNNFGIQQALDDNSDYIFLHNADGVLDKNAIQNMVEVMEDDSSIGQSQSLMLLENNRNNINTAGNKLNYLGVGFCSLYNKKSSDYFSDNSEINEIGYASGAATLLRTDLLRKFGFLSSEFFLYHEDTEYSLRLKIRGYKIILVPSSIFYHDYTFSKNTNKFFWIERNRHALKILFYKWPTILLLLPLEILYNIGLIVLSIFSGWFIELLKVYAYWIKPANWSIWLTKRRGNMAERVVTDSKLLSRLSVTVEFLEMRIPTFIKKIINGVFTFYYFFFKILIRW